MRYFNLNNLVIHDITQDISTVGYGIHTPVRGLDFPAIRLATQDKPGEHGAIVMNQLYGGRVLHLTGLCQQPTIQTFQNARRALQAAIRIVKNNYVSQSFLNKFTTDDGLLLQFYAYAQVFQMDYETPTKANFMLDLFASDPYFYNQTATTSTLAIGSGSVTNLGDANSYPILTFNNLLTNPIVTDTTTGETFKLNYNLTGGHSIVVDTAAKTVVLDGTTNLMAAFDSGNTWLSWVPGLNNLTLATSSGGDSGNVGISFRDAFVGT